MIMIVSGVYCRAIPGSPRRDAARCVTPRCSATQDDGCTRPARDREERKAGGLSHRRTLLAANLGLACTMAAASADRVLAGEEAETSKGYNPNEQGGNLETSMSALAGKGELQTSAISRPASRLTLLAPVAPSDYGKTKMRFSDYVLTESGLQYKDLKEGTGSRFPKAGDQVVVDWDGYTIGYYGRIFEARNKPKGSSFEGSDRDFFRFRVGENEVGRSKERLSVCLRVRG